MDSIKIIKKHGQPGGLPTVTVYVAEDAPGESGGKLYLHQISIPKTSPLGAFYVLSNDNTPWVLADLVAFLKDNGYTSTSSAFTLTPFGLPNPGTNKIRMPSAVYYKESTNKVVMRVREFSFNIADSAITIAVGGVLVDDVISDLTDVVTNTQGVD